MHAVLAGNIIWTTDCLRPKCADMPLVTSTTKLALWRTRRALDEACALATFPVAATETTITAKAWRGLSRQANAWRRIRTGQADLAAETRFGTVFARAVDASLVELAGVGILGADTPAVGACLAVSAASTT
jgi:hypothetical protein